MNAFILLVMAVLVVAPIFLTRSDGSFSKHWGRKLKLPYNEHWEAFYGNIFIVIPALGLIVYYLPPISFLWRTSLWIIGLIASWFIHRKYWKGEPGYMMPDRRKSGGNIKNWQLDMSISGWSSFAFLAMVIILLIRYTFAPLLPGYIVVCVGILLLLYNIVGVISYKHARTQTINVVNYNKKWELIVRFAAVIIITLIKWW